EGSKMSCRHIILSTTAIVSVAALSAPAFSQIRSFNIPAQDAVKAIPDFARQAQVQVVASARDLSGVSTQPVKGSMDTRQALSRLIAGTPLRVASDDGTVITLRSERPPEGGDRSH